jgi:hypothetical protein
MGRSLRQKCDVRTSSSRVRGDCAADSFIVHEGGPGPVSFSGAYRGGCSGHEMPTFETSIGSFHKIEE